MGNESSRLVEEDGLRHDSSDEDAPEGGKHCGFRILGIQEQSPASTVGFVSFFDFIVEANGIRLDTRDATLMELLAQSEDRPIQLRVLNAKSQTTRELQLTPSRKWPGKGLIGVTIRFDSYEGVEDQLVHVLNVAASSPAERAGLRAGSDYLLGTPDRVFTDAEDLHDAIIDALDRSLQCYVYNAVDDQVRIVSIELTEGWGGDGLLGAEVGHGYLHRLPSVCRNTIGSSVGFVDLPKGAKAATDAFLKPHQLRGKSQGNDEVHEKPAAQESKLTLTSHENRQAQSPTCETIQQAVAEQPIRESDEAESVAASSSDAKIFSPTESRYTAARTDLQFPISTVAVFAEP